MPQPATTITPELDQRLADLRSQKGLKAVASDQEGSPLASVAENTFGYTSSPLGPSTPLFAKRIFQCFEVHKLTGGIVHLLGFVTEKEAARVFESGQAVELNLYPEPREESSRLVEIPLERIARAKPLTRSDGNYMGMTVDPA